jgi:molybdopterin adenylyltransferase
MITVGIITVSDRSHAGTRKDQSGPAIRLWAEEMGFTVELEAVIPDEYELVREKLIEFSDRDIDLILTTGGTGLAKRDVTPDATLSVIEKHAPGFAEVMRMRSLDITPHAMLSRAVSGIRKNSLIINLPGSPKSVKENLGFIQDAVPHAIDILKGEVTDCGR